MSEEPANETQAVPPARPMTPDEIQVQKMAEAARSHTEMSRIGRARGFEHTDYALACLDDKMDILNAKMNQILDQLVGPKKK